MERLPGTVPLYTADEMRTLDRITVEHVGIPGAVLMERAGLAAAGEIVRRFDDPGEVVVVCGPGNNGGDGFVVARHLWMAGIKVRVLLTETDSTLRRESKLNFDILEQLDIPVARVNVTGWKRALGSARLIVDAILGTGVSGAPKPAVQTAIDAINKTGCRVVSLDVPSGIDASTGEVATSAVRADLTVSFHGLKIGLAVAPGRFHAGEVVIADIGIPPTVEAEQESYVATRALLSSLPAVERQGNKYTAGSVLVVGGSRGMSGAPMLSARAALRAGAGVVRLIAPRSVAETLDGTTSEILVAPCAEDPEGAFAAGAFEELRPQLEWADVVVLGPGMGRSKATAELVHAIADAAGSLVLDADALWAFSGETDKLVGRADRSTVLTPHEGELARLLGQESDGIRSRRLHWVRQAALQTRATILLKGEDTIVCRPNGSFLVGTSHLAAATAGSGDVLAGTVSALLARDGVTPHVASACASVACAEAARLSSVRAGDPRGVVASDILEALPRAFGNAQEPVDVTRPLELS